MENLAGNLTFAAVLLFGIALILTLAPKGR